MSLYNMIKGFNPATFLFLPMLGEKHYREYPRFRDCFIDNENKEIEVYTRVGGDNRDCGYGEEELYKHPNYLRTEDDGFDSTYATYYFSVPNEYKEDYKKILDKDYKNISQGYKDRLRKIYPNLEDVFNEIF